MATNITIQNTNQRNQLKISIEVKETDPKTKKVVWNPTADQYLKPGESAGVWAAESRKIIIQEMPT